MWIGDQVLTRDKKKREDQALTRTRNKEMRRRMEKEPLNIFVKYNQLNVRRRARDPSATGPSELLSSWLKPSTNIELPLL